MFLFYFLACSNQPAPKPKVVKPAVIRKEIIQNHAKELASDAYLGRGTLEPGLEKAARYISSEFQRIGLTPISGQEDYTMPYTLYQSGWEEGAMLSIGYDEERQPLASWVPFPFSDSGDVRGELVFAGYGITAPEYEWDDYEDLDVEGKIVLVLRREPGADDPDSLFDGTENTEHSYFRNKANQAVQHGAIGMIVVNDPKHPNKNEDFRQSPQLSLDAKTSSAQQEGPLFLAAHVSTKIVEKVLAHDQTLSALHEALEKGKKPRDLSIPHNQIQMTWNRVTKPTPVTVHNVVGVLEGSDPKLREEWLVVGAHYDHLGAFEGEGDTIFNGADDNASGTSALLTMAEAFANHEEAPKRTMVFITFSAEELGLLGSKAFVEQIEIERVRFMLNFDMIGRNSDQELRVIGDGWAKDLGARVQKANTEIGLKLTLAGDDYFGASDHDSFYRKSRPFLFFFTGTHEDYHQLSDHVDKLDFEQMTKITKLGYNILLPMADGTYAPDFVHLISWMGVKLMVEEGKVRVQEILSDGRAEESDIRREDELVQLDDEEYAAETLLESLKDLKPGREVMLVLRRDGVDIQKKLERAKVGYVGVYPTEVSSEDRAERGIIESEGVFIQRVLPDGPADQAGIKSGDIILQIEGRSVLPSNLSVVLQRVGAGEEVLCLVLRKNERIQISMILGERPSRK